MWVSLSDIVMFSSFSQGGGKDEKMKPGERIRLITECTGILIKKHFSEAQLTLDQFGFRTFDPDNGYGNFDENSYFMDQIKVGTDDQLFELHLYLMGADAGLPTEPESSQPWDSHSIRLFFSHKYEDRVFVGDVKRILGSYDIDAFVAHNDIEPNVIWRTAIKSALATCHVFVALLHAEFHQSQWCDQEVGWALGRDIPVAAIRRDFVERGHDGFLEERQDIIISTNQTRIEWFLAWKILLLVLNDPRTHEKGLHALAEAFVNSFSYANTRALWALIEQEPRWESEQLRRFEYAVATNPQVYEAGVNSTFVPVLVKALIEKFEPPTSTGDEKDPWNPDPPF